MYNGKILKCLVAPYHSHRELEETLSYTPTTYLFPEREMTLSQVRGFINMIVNSPKIKENDEVIIITTSQNIIIDMIDGCVRVLKEDNEIVNSPCKTFMANIHTIRYKLLENKHHRLSKKEQEEGKNLLDEIISTINDYREKEKSMKRAEYDALTQKVKLIGEPFIRNKLLQMAGDIKVISNKTKEQLIKDVEKAVKNEDFMLAAEIKKEIENL